jgi:hypothetical protein
LMGVAVLLLGFCATDTVGERSWNSIAVTLTEAIKRRLRREVCFMVT